jgi:hypothetical protein
MNKILKYQHVQTLVQKKEIFLQYYTELWTNNSLQENSWNTGNVDDEIITMEELKKHYKTKMENHQAQIN